MKANEPYQQEISDDTDQPLSKTKRKAAMDALQEIGVTLTTLSKEKLNKLDLPETLRIAIDEAKRINSNGALRRQRQYIGSLMRQIDITPIVTQLEKWEGKNVAENAFFHRLENWRTRLLTDDQALDDLLVAYPQIDIQQVRTLIRNAKREQSSNKPPKSSRALFKLLREAASMGQEGLDALDDILPEDEYEDEDE